MKKEYKEPKKAGIRVGVVSGLIILLVTLSFTMPTPVMEEWQIIWKFNSASASENAPGAGASGWLATFCLDYAETPANSLKTNATNGTYDTWTTNVSGYANADDTNYDLASEDPFYFVVRARFNKTHCWDVTQFLDSRCSIRLTVSGDETISDVEGTRVVSMNNSGYDYIYINFYWDDAVDGYRITDDGSLAWNVTISAKY